MAQATIKSIAVRGNQRLEPATIRAYANLSPGQTYTAASLDQALKDRIGKIFGQATKVLGSKDAGELFVTLGPKVVTNQNALPFTQQIADQLRSWRLASAAKPDCNCNIEMDTCDLVPDPWLQCSELYSCNFDLNWPMCGPFWSWACTGWCKIIRWPEID